uniref:Integrase catalytic domain-containing protein n=1 Tax=Ficedula albicollis TaxID=59894 RepID=A0A803WF74_FICAL
MVDHLTHWVEAFPTVKETSEVVVKIILEQIIPRYGLVNNIDSDRGPHFTSRILHQIIEALGIKWRLHTPRHPQSSGRVERMNKTLKNVLTKLIEETQMNWLKCLPLALLRIRTRPRADIGVSPYEIMFGLPFLITPFSSANYLEGEAATREYLRVIGKTIESLKMRAYLPQTSPLDSDAHQISPGDWVLVKSWTHTPLSPRYEGPFQVLLTTHTAVRTQERGWAHISRIKGPVPPSTGESNPVISHPGTPEWTVAKSPTGLRLAFKRKLLKKKINWKCPWEKNWFIDLVERISKELNITDCWLCGNTQMSEIWPWEGISLKPLEILKWKQMKQAPQMQGQRQKKEQWNLKYKIIGEECIKRTGNPYKTFVGTMACKRYLTTKNSIIRWIPKEPNKYWEAPKHLFWICGNTAYTNLPGDWFGSCTIGIIKPAFFLLPRDSEKRSVIDISGTQKWKGEVWTPERIIEVYGPATWAQDGSWGYRAPIYMLNRIIRLQAVLEVISNQTALALDYVTHQLTQNRAVVYQIRLAVDYLLANEGGICGKFNTSECCLEIDNKKILKWKQ